MSPRQPKQFEEIREKSKEKILYAAFELFSTIGYWSTSISKIAKHAGISKGLMYNYFTSKEHLLRAVVDRIMNIINDVVSIDDKDLSPEQKMMQILDKIFNHIEHNSSLMRMITKISLQIGHFEFVNEIMVKQYTLIINKIEGVLAELNFKNPRKEALVLGATIDGVIIQSLMFGDDYPISEIKEEIILKYTVAQPKQ